MPVKSNKSAAFPALGSEIVEGKATTAKTHAVELVRIPFPGGDLYATKDEQGDAWLAVKLACDEMGVDAQAQQRRLDRQKWATTAIMAVVAADGKVREMFCLHVDSVPMWLSGLEADRIRKQPVRERVELWQAGATKALNRWVRGEPVVAMNARAEQPSVGADREMVLRVFDQYAAESRANREHWERVREEDNKRWDALLGITKTLAEGGGNYSYRTKNSASVAEQPPAAPMQTPQAAPVKSQPSTEPSTSPWTHAAFWTAEPAAFADMMRQRRYALRLSQRQLAHTAGVSLSTVKVLERGRPGTTMPRQSTCRALFAVLGGDATAVPSRAAPAPRPAVTPDPIAPADRLKQALAEDWEKPPALDAEPSQVELTDRVRDLINTRLGKDASREDRRAAYTYIYEEMKRDGFDVWRAAADLTSTMGRTIEKMDAVRYCHKGGQMLRTAQRWAQLGGR